MPTQGEAFAAQFTEVNDAIIAVVDQCSDAQWRQITASEGWSIGVVAHHIAVVHRDFAGLLDGVLAGAVVSPQISMEEVHRSNAQHARDYADVGTAEVIETLRTNGAAVVQRLRRLDDGDFDRIAGVFGDQELQVAQVVEWIVIGHAREHLQSLRATLAG